MKRTACTVGWIILMGIWGSGCGPAPPKVVLEAPKDYPVEWGARKLFHTPQAYIYARSELAAGEADRWVKEVKDYVQSKYKRELGKGIVVIMEPADEPIVRTLEDELNLEQDPSIMPTPPRKPQSPAEIREKLAKDGVPEAPSVRGQTLPMSAGTVKRLGLNAPAAPWAVAAPSHDLAVECGVEVGVGILRTKKPDWSVEQARKAANSISGSLAKSFEIVRGDPVFILWAQQQKDWSDDQKREAIRERLRHTCRSNWLPAPKDEDLGW